MEHSIRTCVLKLYQIGAVKFGQYTLKSGQLSPIYIDLRLIVSYPELLGQIADLFGKKIEPLAFDCLCGVPYTALPIATALSLNYQVPMVMRRKEAKNYGTKKIIEGVIHPQDRCLVVEDLITSGLSIFETIEPLEKEGLIVKDVVVFLDREQGGRKQVEAKGYQLHSVLTLSQLLTILLEEEKIPVEVVQEVQSLLC